MKNEGLKATTVRFTDSDLHLIDRLQEKLGLGMIHVIRLAIRRLAESENLPLLSTPKKRQSRTLKPD
jgi:antitoxin component of RelBE/YafQ-DinJ toxin-antitoxin module